MALLTIQDDDTWPLAWVQQGVAHPAAEVPLLVVPERHKHQVQELTVKVAHPPPWDLEWGRHHDRQHDKHVHPPELITMVTVVYHLLVRLEVDHGAPIHILEVVHQTPCADAGAPLHGPDREGKPSEDWVVPLQRRQ